MRYKIYEVIDKTYNLGICLATDFNYLLECFDEGRGFRPESNIDFLLL